MIVLSFRILSADELPLVRNRGTTVCCQLVFGNDYTIKSYSTLKTIK